MEHIGDVKVSDNTQYWTYIINEKSWKKLLNYVEENVTPYIMSFKNANVLKGDIICVYVTQSSHNGYVAIIQAHKDLKPNKKIKIFKDEIANNFCVKIRVFTLLQKTFNLSTISVYFEGDPNFKSMGAFRSKYIKGDLMFTNIPNSIGKNMIKGLYELSDECEQTSIQEEEEKKIEKDKKKKKNKKTDIYVIKKHKNVSHQPESNYEYSAEDFDIIENDSESYADLDECVSFEKPDTITPMVPILFDPCENFRWYNECNGNKDFIKEFKKHYIRCKDCKCTNNNDKDINTYIDNCDIKFEIACDGDSEFENLLNAYGTSKEYNIDKNRNNFIQLHIIDNKSHSYNRAIIIEWGVNIVKYTKARLKCTKKNNKCN